MPLSGMINFYVFISILANMFPLFMETIQMQEVGSGVAG